MWALPYAGLFALPGAWALARRYAAEREAAVVALIAAALILFVGLRFQVGGDWYSYALMFGRSQSYPLLDALAVSDPLYMLINVAAGRLGFGIGLVNLVCAALLVSGLLAYCRRLDLPPVALLVAVPMLLIVFALNATRQASAVGTALWALHFFLNARPGRGSAALVAALALHWSAAVLLPLGALFLLGGQVRARTILLAWTAVGGAIFVATILMPGLAGATGAAHPSGGALLRLLPSFVAAALLIAFGRRITPAGPERTIAFYLAGLVLFLALVLPVSALAADRLSYFTIPLQMLVAVRAVALLPAGSARTAAIVAICAGPASLFIVWAALSPYAACMAPYRSYLGSPALLMPRGEAEPLGLRKGCAGVPINRGPAVNESGAPAASSLHLPFQPLDSRHHHSLSEQDAPSRSAFNALIG